MGWWENGNLEMYVLMGIKVYDGFILLLYDIVISNTLEDGLMIESILKEFKVIFKSSLKI